MSYSNNRNKDYETAHHLVSRIAHRVYFLKEDVPNTERELSMCLAYIHLNPIRAAVTDKFDGYLRSSFSAFVKGDATAVGGMRFIYGNEDSEAEIASRHEYLLEELLESEKLKRAEEIARKRAVGFEMPADPLTTEAMVAQRAAHQAEVQKALIELREARMCAKRGDERRELTYKVICALLGEHFAMDVHQLAEQLSLGMGMTYRILAEMKKRGMICQEKYGGAWRLSRK